MAKANFSMQSGGKRVELDTVEDWMCEEL